MAPRPKSIDSFSFRKGIYIDEMSDMAWELMWRKKFDIQRNLFLRWHAQHAPNTIYTQKQLMPINSIGLNFKGSAKKPEEEACRDADTGQHNYPESS